MSTESTSNNVPILSETNYSIWKIRIRAKLQREKVWGTISGDDPDPSALGLNAAPVAITAVPPSASAATLPSASTTVTSAGAATATAAATTTTPSTVPFPSISLSASSSGDSWKVRNDKALGIIVEYVSNEKLDIIADETIAKAAWEKLERVHQGTNVALVVFFTFTDMLRRKYAEGASMEEHIASFAADN